MGKQIIAISLIMSLCLLSACMFSEHPLSPIDPKTSDDRLIGTWVGNAPPEPNGITWMHFAKAGDGVIEAVLVSPSPRHGNDVAYYRLHTTAYGSNRYMNVKLSVPDEFGNPDLKKKLALAGYIFVRYAIDGDDLRVWTLTKLEPIEAAVKSGELKGSVVPGARLKPTEIHLSDTSEKILRFVTATNHGEIFEPLLFCHRVKDLPPKQEQDPEQSPAGDVLKAAPEE